ncbi:hypothetical protein DW352_18445 [Pseudolabrys taiwanensis]|uniref:Uncharacterized protein n=1 Tax=Pseudolabrys taiwanensis TaxID=331696 RepID=A0A345ZZH7_9HYPH|nr:hypothetical protein DW352_18445 [Pseudolabrys taiwanensis]
MRSQLVAIVQVAIRRQPMGWRDLNLRLALQRPGGLGAATMQDWMAGGDGAISARDQAIAFGIARAPDAPTPSGGQPDA